MKLKLINWILSILFYYSYFKKNNQIIYLFKIKGLKLISMLKNKKRILWGLHEEKIISIV